VLSSGRALFGWWPGGYETTTASHASSLLKKRFSTQMIYAPMCPASGYWFIDRMVESWNAGQIPIFSWEPYPGDPSANNPCSNEGRPRYYPARIATSPEFDGYIRDVAGKLFEFLKGPDGAWGTNDDRRMYLSIGSEMNGNFRKWYSPAKTFKAMHRKIVDIIRSVIPRDNKIKTRLQVIWTVNNFDVGKVTAQSLYPGKTHVDWVGIDGYNWAGVKYPWMTVQACFQKMMAKLRKIGKGKPLAVIEIGISSKKGVSKKNQWIATALKYFKSKKVRLLSWFNENKEADWTVFTKSGKGNKSAKIAGISYKYYSAWAKGIKSKYFIGSNKKNPRLVSDRAFLGKS